MIKCNYHRTFQTRKGHVYIISPKISSEKSLDKFFQAFKSLQIAKLLCQAGINKSTGISAYEVFQTLIVLVFRGKNLYQFLASKKGDQIASKNTYYRFLNNNTFNWRHFLLLLVVTSKNSLLCNALCCL